MDAIEHFRAKAGIAEKKERAASEVMAKVALDLADALQAKDAAEARADKAEAALIERDNDIGILIADIEWLCEIFNADLKGKPPHA